MMKEGFLWGFGFFYGLVSAFTIITIIIGIIWGIALFFQRLFQKIK